MSRDELYDYLWGRFNLFAATVSDEQRVELDGLLWDIAGELTLKFTVVEAQPVREKVL